MKNYKKGSFILLLLALSFYFPIFTNLIQGPETVESLDSPDIPFNPPKFDQASVSRWRESVRNADLNQDGINDQFEEKLNSLSAFSTAEDHLNEHKIRSEEDIRDGLFANKIRDLNQLSHDHIPIVLFFPEGDIDSIISLFETLGGSIKSIYGAAINGFAGTIDYDNLSRFCDKLLQENTPFLVEEDSIFEADLYFTSRNMNLRPYVWNTLGYTGDLNHSIAIIDSGIDDSHNSFTPGYSDGDFSYKIVGWRDEVNGLPSPYDDNFHGTHCAGIAAGNGSAVLDGEGRTVSTFNFALDYTGMPTFPGSMTYTAARFNVTDPGNVTVQCEFTDLTPGLDACSTWAYLYYNEMIVDSIIDSSSSWNHTLLFNATTSFLGDYSVRLTFTLNDNDGNFQVEPHFGFRNVVHWHFNPPLMGGGDPWKGVAPDAPLVGIKVMSAAGEGSLSDIIGGVNWAITNRLIYNITTISMSLGGFPGQMSLISAVNNAVENGIVTVVAAGNNGAGMGNAIGSPGDADNVITVAALSNSDNITDYSSQGGLTISGNTIKPDITAPGGSFYNFTMFSVDSNDNDSGNEFPNDAYSNDLASAVGTSMSAPAVAGVTNLLIEAMCEDQEWNYTAVEAKRVKAILLMTATETYPLTREVDTGFSPQLDRGGKDAHEGYGRINPDMALEAYTQELTEGSNKSIWISSSLINSFNKHGFAGFINLSSMEGCYLTLAVPVGTDFDMHLYSNTPTSIGEPVMVASSTSDQLGTDEAISYVANESGRYYLVVKAISGEGYANLTYKPNLFAPTLTNGSVAPPSGNQTTLFNFSVVYSDQDDLGPVSISVLINGTSYTMEPQNPSDTNYTDGYVFQYLIYLQPGYYNYSFECYDGKFSNSTATFGLIVTGTPNVNPPVLSDGQVNPIVGGLHSTFIFTVNYTDAENNPPTYVNVTINSTEYSMIKQDSLDSNYMDGCWYEFGTTLPELGSYIYYFNCSDANYTANLGPFSGPTVRDQLLFDGMYVDYDFAIPGYGYGPSTIPYSMLSVDIYNASWTSFLGPSQWNVNVTTRIISNSGGNLPFIPGSHDPIWIFTNVSIGDMVLISVADEGDHVCNVTGETTYLLPGFGLIEVWILEDLTEPGGVAWYEKSTGLLLNSTHYFFGGIIYYTFDFMDTNVDFTYVPNNYAPELTMGSLNPSSGNQSTQFNFSVIYTDLDDNFPMYINVLINGTSYLMDPINPLDMNYTDGCAYQYLTYLQPGMYNYSFECADWKFSNSTKTYFGLNVTAIPNSNAPVLSNGQVNPPTGSIGITNFLFTVNYTDVDNNMPSYINVTINSTQYPMNKQNPLDSYFIDGCIYEFSTVLNELGVYTYHFNCSDGKYNASLGPYTGPTVEPPIIFDGLYIDHYVTVPSVGEGASSFTFSHVFEDIFQDTWNLWGSPTTWDENVTTRIISNDVGSAFGDGSHTPVWIFSTTTLGETVPLGVLSEGDHNFNVTDELIYMLPGFGPVGVWVLEDLTLPTYPAIVWYEKSTGILLNGTFYLAGGAASYIFDFLDTNASITVVGNDYAPELTSGRVVPLEGNQTTLFNFSVVYTDLDNNPPIYLNVLINGTPYPMEPQNPSDTIYTDGCLYQYLTFLLPGLYNYSFKCADWTYTNSTDTYFGLNVTSINSVAPELLNPQVNPSIGGNSTPFDFTVWYYDIDNNFPVYVNITINTTTYSMFPSNPLDMNMMDGAQYYFTTQLDFGNYQFQINCSDGVFTNSTDWILAPEVNPFYGLSPNLFHDDFEDGLSQWESITGLWHLTDNSSSWSDPYHSPVHSMWFGQESTGNYETGSREMGNLTSIPFDLSKVTEAYLEFFHWRSGEPGFDYSYVYISTSGDSWDLLYSTDADIAPWENRTLDISAYCGNDAVRIRFYFDTGDSMFNFFRGWLVDDVTVYSPQADGRPLQLLSPNNGNDIITTWVNFTWTSIEIPIGSVNYTLQISNETNFSNIVYELENVPETPINTSASVYFDYPGDTYYWRVRPSYESYYGNWTDWFCFIVLVNDFPPNLTAGSVDPLIGDQFTIFNFSVTYTDQDNNTPIYVNVLINGTPYLMEQQNPADFDFTDGCIYQYLTNLTVGLYNYSFECADYKFTNSTDTYFGLNVTESNDNPPMLSDGQVNPGSGFLNLTVFVFTVNYTDVDNNAPDNVTVTINTSTYLMTQQNSLDLDYMDGCIFNYSTILENGTYIYHFNCSDGLYTASDGPYIGPIVSLIILWNETRLDGIRIGTVITHGEDNPRTIYPVLVAELISRGATVTDITSTIDASVLSNYDIIWFDEYGSAMQVSEIDAIESWVQNGGNFIITGDNMGSAINLLQRFNIAYGASPPGGITSDIYPHPITFGVNQINFPSPMVSLDISLQPSATLCVESSTFDMVTAMEFGDGKLVVIVDENVLTSYTSVDNHQLINNSFGWLGYLPNDFAPTLTAPSVVPTDGNQTTQFNFSVIYTDADDNPPIYINVLINGTPSPMDKQNPSDINYTDGCVYQYLTYLLEGMYNYSFECADSKFSNITGTYFGLNVTEFNDNPPQLSNGQVNPGAGYNDSTLFVFTVNYTDLDNNPPIYVNVTINTTIYSMIPQNPLDTNYMDGCIFIFNTTLGSGTYFHYFNCSDGTFTNSTDVNLGPTVTLFTRSIVGVRVAVLNAASNPPYFTGGSTNDFTSVINALIAEGAIAENVTSTDIINGALANYDIFIMIDNAPSAACEAAIINAWMNGLPIIAFDSSVCAMCYFGILPNASYGSNGNGVYWTYGSGATTEIVATHPIVSDYTVGEIVTGSGGNARWFSPVMSGVAEFPYLTVLGVDTSDTSMWTILLYEPPLYGPTLHLWDNDPVNEVDLWPIVLNAISYFCPRINDYTPELLSPKVEPLIGTQNTLFNFTVTYLDQDNNPPFYVNVLINGTPYPMNKQIPSDNNYTDGCAYEFLTYLSPGLYNYSFECADWLFYNSTTTYFGLNVTEENLVAPQLLLPEVTPTLGGNSTLFNFTVWYFDVDSNSPIYINITINTMIYPMLPANPTDTNYTDGALYYYITLLDYGYYQFQINCSDFLFTNATGWINAPEVNPFYDYPVVPSLLTPFNESSLFSGWTNFTWDSLELPLSALNYTIQISNSTNFLYLFFELGNITETLVNTSANILLNYPTGTYYWRVRPTYVPFNGNWSEIFTFDLTLNDYEPSLTSGAVIPLLGNQSTEFNFTVMYMDLDNDPPVSISVLINGTPFSMEQQNIADVDYTDGCMFQYLTYLIPGMYNYSFECFDGRFYNSTDTFFGLNVTEVNLIAPELLNPQVTPTIGGNSTLFNFTVWYLDADNSFPSYVNITINTTTYSMLPVNPLDSNFMDGALYHFNTTLLVFGFYQFQINCSDGGFTNATGWTYGPEVNPLYDYVQDLTFLLPINGSSQLTGWTTFAWNSLDLPLGSVNYTLQLSNTSDFLTIIYELGDINEIPSITFVDLLLNLTPGRYYWRVRATYDTFNGSWSDPCTFMIIESIIPPPGFFERFWWLFLVIGISVAAVVAAVVVTRKRRKTLAPLPPLGKPIETPSLKVEEETLVVVVPEEEIAPVKHVIEEPMKKIVDYETPLYYCQACKQSFQIKVPFASLRYSCPNCDGILLRVVKCPHCEQKLSLKQEEYAAKLGKPIPCPSCGNTSLLSTQPKPPAPPPVEEEKKEKLAPIYLKLDPEQFRCTVCGVNFKIENPDLTHQYQCPRSGHILKRYLECPTCGHILPFSQENYSNFAGKDIACPKCKTMQEEEELSKILARLREGDAETRLQALELLGEIGNKKAAPFLIDALLHDPEDSVRAKAATAIGMIGVTSVLPILKRLIREDPNPEVRKTAAEAVEWIEGLDEL